MSVYVITGVSKGIGFEFINQISADPKNLVVGLVRDKAGTEKKVAAELGDRPNLHILHGDLTKRATLEKAAVDTAEIVGERGVDYLIANGALVSAFDAYAPIGALAEKPEELDAVVSELWQTNITGNIHLFKLFLPLIQKGKVKKVITITTGLADLELTNQYEMELGSLYAASKAALNLIVGKFHAQYKKEGILFVSISPGVVDVGRNGDLTPEELQQWQTFGAQVMAYAPDWKGPITPEESVRDIQSTFERINIEDGFGGAFISHHGDKKWV
ncbi:putative short chain dehydrogenase [Pestalotiopsis sp. NC0098]|nr:putative short chain dehydrogenase [Pestalotiopsis sp. NC0098]